MIVSLVDAMRAMRRNRVMRALVRDEFFGPEDNLLAYLVLCYVWPKAAMP